MQPSFYNVYFSYNGKQIVYNTLTKNTLSEDSNYFNDIHNIYDASHESLEYLSEKGFVVKDQKEESLKAEQYRYNAIWDNEHFRVTFMVTYDCNFACPYCHQEHSKNTNITSEAINSAFKIIKHRYETVGFKSLFISLFGGEPFFNRKASCEIIKRSKEIAKELNVDLKIYITTNGSLYPIEIIDELKGVNDVNFQITIDGEKENHNHSRIYLNGKGSYDNIIRNVQRLHDTLQHAMFYIRYNFDGNVGNGLESFINDLSFLDRNRSVIWLHKIFQEKTIDVQKLTKAIAMLNAMRFAVKASLFSVASCYMAKENVVVINHDGRLFRCTSLTENCKEEGSLEEDGAILWNHEVERTLASIPPFCKMCRLMPMCLGPCYKSKRLDTDNNKFCNRVLPDEQIIKFLFKQLIIKTNNEKRASSINNSKHNNRYR